jgi:hypothetical protein
MAKERLKAAACRLTTKCPLSTIADDPSTATVSVLERAEVAVVKYFLLLLFSGTALAASKVMSAPAPEPYFGRYGSLCPAPDTTGAQATGQDAAVASPVAKTDADVIDGYVVAAAAGKDTTAFVDWTKIPPSTRESCTSVVVSLARANSCKSRPLYLLGDREIRQAWLCNGRLAYFVFYTIKHGRITNIWTTNGAPPVVVVRGA